MSNEIALLNKDIKRFKGVVADLSKENKQLKIKLEKIKEVIIVCNQNYKCSKCLYENECLQKDNKKGDYHSMDELILKIIEGAKDE